MPLFSSFLRPAAARSAREPVLAWRKNDFVAYPAGPETQMAMLRGCMPVALPGFVVDFVNSCGKFAPLETHVAKYADQHAWGGLETEALRSWLPRLTEARFLVSTGDVLEACAECAGAQAGTISAIGFPTGGARVDLVGRALASFAGNAREHGRGVEFIVSDGSEDAGHGAAFEQACAQWAREHGAAVHYLGEGWKRRLAAGLVERGFDAEVVEFALFDPLRTGFSCGANRNALLLHQAGRMFCSVDDDVVCELSAAPACDARLKFFSQCDPFTRWLFADRDSALAHAGKTTADFLGSHEAVLGRGLAELANGMDPAQLDAEQVSDDFLRRLWTKRGRVRASFSGHVGDPGIPTSVYFLFYDGENRRRFTEDEARYRAVLGARSVFALAPCVAVGDSSTSPGMAMGLDHRELLPPFFPVLHAEDFIYGAVLWQTVGDAFLGHAPLAVRHEPRPGKGILQPADLGPERRATVFEFAHLIRRIILRFARGESSGPAERMDFLGRHLEALAGQSAADFREYLRGEVLELESAKIDRLEEQLREDTETPDWWRSDLESYLAHVRDALVHDDFDIPFDLKQERNAEENRVLMQKLFGNYGRLLQQWPGMVAAARELL